MSDYTNDQDWGVDCTIRIRTKKANKLTNVVFFHYSSFINQQALPRGGHEFLVVWNSNKTSHTSDWQNPEYFTIVDLLLTTFTGHNICLVIDILSLILASNWAFNRSNILLFCTMHRGFIHSCDLEQLFQYHTIPYYTAQYHTIPYYTAQYHAIPYYTAQYHAIPERHKMWTRRAAEICNFYGSQRGIKIFTTKATIF